MPRNAAKRSDHSAADKIASLVALDAMMELVQTPHRFFWLNFAAGFWRGVGGVVGAAIVIVILGYIVHLLGGIPFLGNFIRNVQHSLPAK